MSNTYGPVGPQGTSMTSMMAENIHIRASVANESRGVMCMTSRRPSFRKVGGLQVSARILRSGNGAAAEGARSCLCPCAANRRDSRACDWQE